MKQFYSDEELLNSVYQKKNKFYMDKNGVYWDRQILCDIIEEVLQEVLQKED